MLDTRIEFLIPDSILNPIADPVLNPLLNPVADPIPDPVVAPIADPIVNVPDFRMVKIVALVSTICFTGFFFILKTQLGISL